MRPFCFPAITHHFALSTYTRVAELSGMLSNSVLPLCLKHTSRLLAGKILNRVRFLSCFAFPRPLPLFRLSFEQLFSRPPDYRFLRTLGCLSFPCIRPHRQAAISLIAMWFFLKILWTFSHLLLCHLTVPLLVPVDAAAVPNMSLLLPQTASRFPSIDYRGFHHWTSLCSPVLFL